MLILKPPALQSPEGTLTSLLPRLLAFACLSRVTHYYVLVPNRPQDARLLQAIEQRLLSGFLEHIPDGVYFKDREGRFVRISRSLAARFGLSDPAQAIDKTDFDMFTAEHAQQAFDDEQEIIHTGQPIVEKEEKETWPDGRETWVLTTKLPLTDAQGNVVGTMGISRDITDRKRAEHELEVYRVRLEELVTKRTAELVRANQLLEEDIAARKVIEHELARSNAELENLSLTDDLTGLYNRKGFLALAEHRVKLAHRTGDPFSVAFVDLDGLKRINDSCGHHEGNRALVETSTILKDSFRQSDIIARLGGDEFAIFVSEANRDEIANRIQQRLDALNRAPGRLYRLSFSVGIASATPGVDPDIQSLLGLADALMYEQKRTKRSHDTANAI